MIDLSFIRPIIELLYTGRATIWERPLIKDKETGASRSGEPVKIYEDLPCRISHGSEPVSETYPVPISEQRDKLFIGPGIYIPPGSRIDVTQENRTVSYAMSGRAKDYDSHQEIEVKIWEDWI